MANRPQFQDTDDELGSRKARQAQPTSSVTSEALGKSPAKTTSVAENHPLETAVEWKIGDVILNLYEVKQIFRGGGMGIVYRMHHRGWNLDLAVKRPRLEYFQTDEDKGGFVREAETWVNLALHPHTVSCHYVREVGGIPTVFIEFIEGGSLHEWICTRMLYEGGVEKALERILDIAIQFAWGLSFAHEQGLVHRDVKPGNVLITRNGVAKVTDFGLARALDQISRSKEPSAHGGWSTASAGLMTPLYASPEQANHRPLTLQTDIWSWAVSVLEMFTGEVTWSVGMAAGEALEDYLESGPEDAAIPHMPEDVAQLLRECFRYEPAQRPISMSEVARNLQRTYLKTTGRAYARRLARAAKSIADGLNNRAVSLLDLGRRADANALWEEALRIQPHHLESTYNSGLLLWRAGQIDDELLVGQMEEVRRSHGATLLNNYLLSLVHLERDDAEAAIEVLEEIATAEGAPAEINIALRIARQRLPHSARLVRTFVGHADSLYSAGLSQDPCLVLSRDSVGVLKLWETETGRCLRTFENAGDGPRGAVLSPDGKYILLSVDYHKEKTKDVKQKLLRKEDAVEKSMELRDAENYNLIRVFEGHTDSVDGFSFTHDGKLVLSASQDKTLRLWETETGRCLRTFLGHTDRVRSASLSRDGKYGLSGSDDRTMKLWEVETGRCLRTFEFEGDTWSETELSANGRRAVSRGKFIKVWDAETGLCVRAFEVADWMTHVTISPDGNYVVSGGFDRTLKLWDVEEGRCLRTFKGHSDYVSSISYSHDGRYAISTSNDKSLKLWSITTGNYVASLALSRIMQSETAAQLETEYEQEIALARVALQTEDFIAAARHTRAARAQHGYERRAEAIEMWGELYRRLPRKALTGGWEKGVLKGHAGAVQSVVFSQDGRFALSGGRDKTIRLWDVNAERCGQVFQGHVGGVTSVSLSADAKLALSGETESKLKLWEVETGRCLQTFKYHMEGLRKPVQKVCLSPNGRYVLSSLATFYDKTLRAWDAATGNVLRVFQGHEDLVNSISVSADGWYVLTGSADKSLKLWELDTGVLVRTLTGHDNPVWTASLTPDGRYAFSGSNEGVMKLWDVETGRCLKTMKEHTAAITSISLSPDGLLALSGSHDKTLKLWETETGRCLRTFEGHTGSVTSVALSPDGRYALSASQDETLRLWVLDWELEEAPRTDWDEGTRRHVSDFIMQHASELLSRRRADEIALARQGKVTWSEEDFGRLMSTLACVGFGHLRAEGVRRELEKMWSHWTQSVLKPITAETSGPTLSSLGVKAADVLRIVEGLIKQRQLENASLLLTAYVTKMPTGWKPIEILPDAYEGYFWYSDDFISYVNYYRKELNEQTKTLTWVDASYSKAYYLLAYIQTEWGNYKTALEMIEQGLLIEPDQPRLLNEKGYILGRMEGFEESLSAYTQALTARPWTPNSVKGRACRGRGVALIDLKRLDEAEEALQQSLVFVPGDEVALHELQYIKNLQEERTRRRPPATKNPKS